MPLPSAHLQCSPRSLQGKVNEASYYISSTCTYASRLIYVHSTVIGADFRHCFTHFSGEHNFENDSLKIEYVGDLLVKSFGRDTMIWTNISNAMKKQAKLKIGCSESYIKDHSRWKRYIDWSNVRLFSVFAIYSILYFYVPRSLLKRYFCISSVIWQPLNV